MAETVLALFDLADEATEAARELRREGIDSKDITIMSNEPIPMEEEDEGQPPTRMGLFAIAGGFLGASAAVSLTVLTSKHIGIVVGGMPIVSPWAFGIIVFELTALGAIVATLGRMLYEAGLGKPGSPSCYDEAVAEGRILLAVACTGDPQADIAERVLRERASEML
jgi:ActD protein